MTTISWVIIFVIGCLLTGLGGAYFGYVKCLQDEAKETEKLLLQISEEMKHREE